jgi:carbon monoxide dehydrogenase subunit G
MKIEQSFHVGAPMQRVWDLFLDARSVSACVPGCLGVEALGPASFAARIQVALGPIKTVFNVIVEIVEQEVPVRLVTVTKGEEGSKSSTLRATSQLSLSQAGDGGTQVSYASEITLLGRLGTFGLGVMKKKAVALSEEFAQAVRARLENQNA